MEKEKEKEKQRWNERGRQQHKEEEERYESRHRHHHKESKETSDRHHSYSKEHQQHRDRKDEHRDRREESRSERRSKKEKRKDYEEDRGGGDVKRRRDSENVDLGNSARVEKRKRDENGESTAAAKIQITDKGHSNAEELKKNVPVLSEIARAKQLLQQRKELLKKIAPMNNGGVSKAASTISGSSSTRLGAVSGNASNLASLESVKRAQECFARLGFQQPPGSMPFMPVPSAETTPSSQPKKPLVLRLDSHGREIDENGHVVERPKVTSVSTLKVNINKQKKDAFQILRPELEEDPVNNPFFDSRMRSDKKKLVRAKRSTFQFVEEGRWAKQAEIMRLNQQFGEAKAKEIRAKQAALAKAKAEGDINPNLIEITERVPLKEEKSKDTIPDVEWWDALLLPSGDYSDITGEQFNVKMEKVTIYVEHPVPIEPPAEPAPPPPQPLKLTKKEMKKMRTQKRLAKEKERQEMIRQGAIEPPKPKVKMSNLFKVLGTQATQDPTKLEQEIRFAAAERERAHSDRNIARKLTPSERRQKKEKKMFDDGGNLDTIVSLYKVNDVSHPQIKFKVDINAQENRLSGCIVVTEGMSLVIVEGGPKSIKRYAKLMLRRINWDAKHPEDGDGGGGGGGGGDGDGEGDGDGDGGGEKKEERSNEGGEERKDDVDGEGEGECEGDGDGEGEGDGEKKKMMKKKKKNKCVLVWQGSVAKPAFDKFMIQNFHTANAARKYLGEAGVAHYWELAEKFVDE